jgi:hypothetical protein
LSRSVFTREYMAAVVFTNELVNSICIRPRRRPMHVLIDGRHTSGPSVPLLGSCLRLRRPLSPMAPMQTIFHRGGNPDGMDPWRKHPVPIYPDPAAPDPIPVSRDPDVGRSRRDAHRTDCDDGRRRRRSADGDSQVYVGCGNQERSYQKCSR